MENYPHLENLSQDLSALIARAGAWTVAVQGGRGPNSSGVLWDSQHVLTTELSIQDDNVEVRLPDGRTVTATVLGRMTGWDLALLKLPEPVEIATPPWNPEPAPGLIVSLGRQLRGGLISSLGMLNSVEQGLRHRSAFGPDFAGGPILDCRGSFLGLNVHGRPPEGVPYKKLQAAFAELSQGRSVEPGYLGLGLLALDQGGCLVVKVESGSPAEKARIMLGDQISSLDGVSVNGPEDVQRELRTLAAERDVTIALQRGGQPLEVTVSLGARPQRGFPGPGRPFFRAIGKLIHHHHGGRHHGPEDRHFGPPHQGPEEDFGPPRHRGGPPHHRGGPDERHEGPPRHRGGPHRGGPGRRGGRGGPPGAGFDHDGPEFC